MRSWWMLLVVLVLVCAGGVWGEGGSVIPTTQPEVESVIDTDEDEADDEQSQPRIELDIAGLLESGLVTSSPATDGVWEVEALPGRKLLQVPLRIEGGDGDTKCGPGTLRVRKGRFLAWRLGDEPSKAPKGSKRAQIIEEEISGDSPTMTRRFELGADGMVRWKLARFIQGGKVRSSGSGYALKLDVDQLRALHPGDRPTVQRRGKEDLRAYYERKRAAEVAHREKASRYLEVGKQVRALPKSFEKSLPGRIWAIVEVDQKRGYLGLSGPGEMAWGIDLDDLMALRALVAAADGGIGKGKGGAVGLTDVAKRAVDAMDRLAVAGADVYGGRAAAYAVGMSDVVDDVEPGDRLFKILNRLVLHEDALTRRVTVKRLIRTFPPTPATRQLIAVASTETIDAEVQLSRLTTLLTMGGDDPGQHRDLVVSANRMLVDPDGPAVEEVLEKLVEAAEGNASGLDTLEEGVRFAELVGQRRKEAVAFVVGHAGDSDLAGRWLDRGLLGSVDVSLVRLTLNILDAAGGEGAGDGGSTLDRGVALLFGPGAGKGERRVPRVEISSAIPIGHADHGLLRVLDKQDQELSRLGWRVLRHFRLGRTGALDDQKAVQAVRVACDGLTGIALSRLPHEVLVVGFLERQLEWTGSTDALVRLVLEGDGEVSLRAVGALMGSRRSLGAAMGKLSADDRHAFAARFYEAERGRVPLAAGLVRAGGRDAVIVDWFAGRVSQGQLPQRDEWAKAFGGEERLLGTLVSVDGDLVAGAVGALVAMIGGAEEDALEMIEQLDGLEEKTLVNLEAHWIHSKSEIFTTKIVEAGGWYEMVLEVREVGQAGSFGQRWQLELGRVYVQTDGRSVRLGNRGVAMSVPSERISMRVDQPEQLRFVVDDRLERLPLDRLAEPLDLLPQADGGWEGKVDLPDGRTLRLVMHPVGVES